MPIDPCHRHEIAAAIAAWNRDHPATPLPRNTERLLAVMFRSDDGVCQLSLEVIAAEGFTRNTLPETLRRMVEAGILSRQRGTPRQPDTYRLHLPRPARP